MSAPPSPKRLLYLDSARGLAALSVITWHFLLAVYMMQTSLFHYQSPFHFFWYGEADVIFFFIHSGFILAYSYAGPEKKLTPRSYIQFLIERIFRIYPLFLFILIISFLAINHTANLHAADPASWVNRFWMHPESVRGLATQSMLIVRVPESANLRLIPQDWTLSVEILAGATVPILAFAGRKYFWAFLLLLAIFKISGIFSTFVFEFGLGVGLFLLRDNIISLWQRIPMVVKFLFLVLTLALYSGFLFFPTMFSDDVVLFSAKTDRIVIDAGCACAFILLLASPKIQRALSARVLVSIGRICYSIYLVHKLIIMICWRAMQQFLEKIHQQPLMVVTAYLVYFITVIVISQLLFWSIEKPANKFGKKIARLVTGQSPLPSPGKNQQTKTDHETV